MAPFGPLRLLVGSWKGTATPLDPESKRRRAFWRESSRWEWTFAKDLKAGTRSIAGLRWIVEDGRRFRGGVLTYDAQRQHFVFVVDLRDGSSERYEGRFDAGRLELTEVPIAGAADLGDSAGASGSSPRGRLAIRVVGENRYTESWWEAASGGASEGRGWRPIVDIGHTRQGVQFAAKATGPVCIVTGGYGTMTVSHQGKTYYVCCEGCRQAFEEDPDTFLSGK